MFQKMNEFVIKGYAVDIQFLGAYMVHYIRDKIAKEDKSKSQRTLANAIHDMISIVIFMLYIQVDKMICTIDEVIKT